MRTFSKHAVFPTQEKALLETSYETRSNIRLTRANNTKVLPSNPILSRLSAICSFSEIPIRINSDSTDRSVTNKYDTITKCIPEDLTPECISWILLITVIFSIYLCYSVIVSIERPYEPNNTQVYNYTVDYTNSWETIDTDIVTNMEITPTETSSWDAEENITEYTVSPLRP